MGLPIDLGNEGRFVTIQKSVDTGKSCHERPRQLRVWSRAHDYEQCHPVADNRVPLVWLIANASIMCESNPTAPADFFKPNFVRRIGREMIFVPFHGKAIRLQYRRKLPAEIAIREKHMLHAARS